MIAPFLAGIGAPLAPHVRTVLRSADEDWIYFVLWNVFDRNPALIDALNLNWRNSRLRHAQTPGLSAGIEYCAAQLLAHGEIRD